MCRTGLAVVLVLLDGLAGGCRPANSDSGPGAADASDGDDAGGSADAGVVLDAGPPLDGGGTGDSGSPDVALPVDSGPDGECDPTLPPVPSLDEVQELSCAAVDGGPSSGPFAASELVQNYEDLLDAGAATCCVDTDCTLVCHEDEDWRCACGYRMFEGEGCGSVNVGYVDYVTALVERYDSDPECEEVRSQPRVCDGSMYFTTRCHEGRCVTEPAAGGGCF